MAGLHDITVKNGIFRVAVLIFLLGAFLPLQARMLDDFAYESDRILAATWQARDQTPRPRIKDPGTRGVRFACPFTKEIDRAYWDRSVNLNLEPFSSFELDLSCPNPGAIRALRLYFKSGDGWYVWGGTLPDAGRQSLQLLKSEFSTEGQPTGWNRIERIRLSPWKGAPVDTLLTVYGLSAQTDGIILLQAGVSAGDESEQRAAERAAARISQRLKNAGIAHRLVREPELSTPGLMQAQVVILPYNPQVSGMHRRMLKSFCRRGGRLMVFYSADAELARMMHLKLGAYSKAEQHARWTSFSFTDPGRWNVPERIYQRSWNIRPVYPADDTAEVIAWWNDPAGRPTRDPAWVASRQGLWMTHVLLADDARSKQEMLSGLLGHLDPSLWPGIAWQALQQAGRIDSFRTFGEAMTGIGQEARETGRAGLVDPILAKARRTHHAMLRAYEARRRPEVLNTARQLRAVLTEAYASAQSAKPGEFRGVWDHSGAGLFPGDWPRTCHILKSRGINAVFPNVAWGGLAHYNSKVLPRSDTRRLYGDQLAACIKAAHARDIEVHAWLVCWNLDSAPSRFVSRMRKEGRLQQDARGRMRNHLCPVHPENRALLMDAVREMVSHYEVDGLHLDYIRFAASDTCFCPVCRRQFEKAAGHRVRHWPDDVSGDGPLHRTWRQWRAAEITSFVRQVRTLVHTLRPEARLSAAVYGNYPGCADSVGQDWAVWARENLVDFICPMNYTEDAARFSTLTRQQLAQTAGTRCDLYPGLGITAAQSQLTPDLVIEQIRVLRELGAPGFMLFELGPTLQEQTLPVLHRGITLDKRR